ncbi:MAG: hypothetical protein P8107_11250 [Spirochaetia bacterium]
MCTFQSKIFKTGLVFMVMLFLGAAGGLLFAQDIELLSQGKVIDSGGSWSIPMNSGSSKVALFSEQREPFSIVNKGSAAVTITSVSLKREAGVMPEEFTLQNTELKPGRLDFKKTTLDPKQSFDFYIRYYPVQSKEVGATVTVEYGAGKKYIFTVKGKGRDSALFSDHISVSLHKLFGGRDTDEMVTGMAADKSGNVYFLGQVTGVKDKFAYDIFYGKITPQGDLAWAKLWAGPYRDYSRDPGQNAETGGSANAVAVDEQGFVYFTGAVSPGSSNNNYAALVVKIDPADGSPVWEKLWRPDWPSSLLAKHSAEAYALDVKDGHVYVTGTTGAALENSDALVFLLGLKAEDGSIEFQKYVDPTPKTNDRGYCIKADTKGNVYVGGLAAKISLLIKFANAAAGKPTVAWVKTYETGWGSSINCLDVDAAGSVYASLDRRGARTYFSFMKLDPKGDVVWGKTYNGGSNKNNNCAVVKVAGDVLFVGGRTGQSWYDAQMGDANLLKVSTADGTELWSAFYYSGKGPDELAEHRVKGFALLGNTLYVVGQVYTGNHNGVRYWGYWYNGVGSLSDYTPQVKDLGMGKGSAQPIPAGAVKDASGARSLVDLKGTVPFQDASLKKDGRPPDGELIYWKLELK